MYNGEVDDGIRSFSILAAFTRIITIVINNKRIAIDLQVRWQFKDGLLRSAARGLVYSRLTLIPLIHDYRLVCMYINRTRKKSPG